MASSFSSSKPINEQTAWKRNSLSDRSINVLPRLLHWWKTFFRKSQILPCSSLETSVRSTAKTAKRIQPMHRSISRPIFASIQRDANCAQMERFSALGRIGSRDYLEGKIPQWGGVRIRKLGGPEDVIFWKLSVIKYYTCLKARAILRTLKNNTDAHNLQVGHFPNVKF